MNYNIIDFINIFLFIIIIIIIINKINTHESFNAKNCGGECINDYQCDGDFKCENLQCCA